jgi:hypothetical protein
MFNFSCENVQWSIVHLRLADSYIESKLSLWKYQAMVFMKVDRSQIR